MSRKDTLSILAVLFTSKCYVVFLPLLHGLGCSTFLVTYYWLLLLGCALECMEAEFGPATAVLLFQIFTYCIYIPPFFKAAPPV